MTAHAYFDYSGTPRGPGSAWAVVVDRSDTDVPLIGGGIFRAGKRPEGQACVFASGFLRTQGITDVVLWTDEQGTSKHPPREARGFEVRLISRDNVRHQRAHDLATYIRVHQKMPGAGETLRSSLPTLDPSVTPQFRVKQSRKGRRKLLVFGITLSGTPKKMVHTLRKVAQLYSRRDDTEQIVRQVASLLGATREVTEKVVTELTQTPWQPTGLSAAEPQNSEGMQTPINPAGKAPSPSYAETRLEARPSTQAPGTARRQTHARPAKPEPGPPKTIKARIREQIWAEARSFSDIQGRSRASASYFRQVIRALIADGEAETVQYEGQTWVRLSKAAQRRNAQHGTAQIQVKRDAVPPTAHTTAIRVIQRHIGPRKRLAHYLTIRGMLYRVSTDAGRQERVTEKILQNCKATDQGDEARQLREQIREALVQGGLRENAAGQAS